MSRKAKAVEPIKIEPMTEPEPAKVEAPKPDSTPEAVKRNIFGQVIKPIVGGIGSGNAK